MMLFFETFFFFKQTPADISVKLFHATEESLSQVENMDIPKEVRDPSCVFFLSVVCFFSFESSHCRISSKEANVTT